jgi:DNA (cytosine-5)-methyltransferase 1
LLQKHFPGAKLYGDIHEFDAKKYNGAVDIISGGDPCQPSSLQSKMLGKADHRYLWPQYLRIVKEVQPLWVVNENVPGSIFNGILDGKISDLEAEGYTC